MPGLYGRGRRATSPTVPRHFGKTGNAVRIKKSTIDAQIRNPGSRLEEDGKISYPRPARGRIHNTRSGPQR